MRVKQKSPAEVTHWSQSIEGVKKISSPNQSVEGSNKNTHIKDYEYMIAVYQYFASGKIQRPLSFTNEVYIFKIKWSMRVNYRISYAKEVQYPSYRTHQTLFSYHIYNRFKFQPKQNFMHFLGTSAILSWNKHRLKINSLTFLQNEFSHSKCFQKVFSFKWGASALRFRVPGWARTPIQWKKAFWKHFDCENSFCKKVKEFILSRGWFQLKMAELPKKCMKFCFGWNLKRL